MDLCSGGRLVGSALTKGVDEGRGRTYNIGSLVLDEHQDRQIREPKGNGPHG